MALDLAENGMLLARKWLLLARSCKIGGKPFAIDLLRTHVPDGYFCSWQVPPLTLLGLLGPFGVHISGMPKTTDFGGETM